MTRFKMVKRPKGVWDIVKAKDGPWMMVEYHEKAIDVQRQIIDEQVGENRGLRADVLLMQRENAEQRQEIARLREALRELHAVVNGECPSLLNEDSGGDARLALEIEELLKEHP